MKIIIVIWCCLMGCFQAFGQDNYVISHLDNTNGLPNNYISGVFQDSDKLLWLNTGDGLDVYNGISFNSFKSSGLQSSSKLPNNMVTQVREDQLGRIWICTEEGITKYSKADGSMSHYFYYNGKANGKSADYMLTISNRNDIICGLRLDSALYRYDYQTNSMQKLRFEMPYIGKVAKVQFDEFGRLWVLNLGGLLRVFEKRADSYHLLKSFEHNITIFHIANHRVFFADRNVELCEITHDFKMRGLQPITHCVQEIQYFQGHYFVAWLYKGVQEFDEHFKPANQLQQYFPALQNLQVNSLTITGGGTLWLATRDKGIFKIKKRGSLFGQPKDTPGKLISGSNVESIQKLGDDIWLATQNNGLIRFALNNSTAAKSLYPARTEFESDNSYWSLAHGYDSNLYIGSDALGVTIYDPVLQKFTPWKQVKGVVRDEDFFRVRSMLPQKDSSLYVGFNGGVSHIKVQRLNNGQFKLVYNNPVKIEGHFLKPGNNLVNALAEIPDWILIGYRFSGLSLLHKASGRSLNIHAQIQGGGLLNNSVSSLLVDPKKRIWIGTSYGLFWTAQDEILKSRPLFHQISIINGLPDNNVHAIKEDDSGNIWVSTNQGLAKINGTTLDVIQYDMADGLQNAEFCDNAAYKDEQGKLYFGGIAGLNYFDPERVALNRGLANLLITDLNVAGKTSDGVQLMVIKPERHNSVKSYHLVRNENYFNLKVQPADGYANLKFRYRYFLQGHDTKWHETGEITKIEYSNIPPGNYSFYIKWSNGQGAWTNGRKIFDMHIRQYFWLTDIAKSVYGLCFIVGIYIYIRIRKGRLEIKQRLELENLIRVKEQKLYQEKMDFFTNITHELQTPLTLILGSIERFLFKNKHGENKHGGWGFLNIANKEAFRLQYLIHRLLEFRKGEAGHLKIRLSEFNFSNLLTGIAELFEPLAEQHQLQTDIAITPGIVVTSDKDKVEMIVFNLLSNAFKYTRPGEEINFTVEKAGDEEIRVTLANSGYNGPTEDMHLLFEQFYTLDNSDKLKVSSGIGLAFARQLTELLGGTINVGLDNDWIKFTVLLPLAVPVSGTTVLTSSKPSDHPSELLRSAIGSQQLMENRVTVNNDLALVENLSDQAKRTILIVEDEPGIRLLLREILADKYIVYEAGNGASAIELLKRIIPNLILSDVLMDELDGLKLCALIKNTFETCHIPFVLLSALSAAEERVEGFEVGADAYIGKPFNAQALLKKIDQLIQYREKIQSFFKKDEYIQPGHEAELMSEDKLFLDKVIKVINEQLASPELDAVFLEKAMAMSKMSLYRKTKAFTGMTPAELIKHIRLTTAASLLRSTSLTVSEIYYQTGFNNQSYFYREFKRVYTCSPKEFRDQQEQPILK